MVIRTVHTCISPNIDLSEFQKDIDSVTQILTRHGSFGTFTKRIKNKKNHTCGMCEQKDDPTHVLYECARWDQERRAVEKKIERILPRENEIVDYLKSSQINWLNISEFMTVVMKKKEKGDREIKG
ncbi:uncharacterized protein LOC130894541 [Diorhabda carinulata]|uniref:uncharacterized protein LOC130894541 n=1 Tax=Diorhabda carinulata TaxID=1163345 RepID=UPI0025A2F00E|nr:uncharacterized protein LOC130894541 [Diorhabda carinulata]